MKVPALTIPNERSFFYKLSRQQQLFFMSFPIILYVILFTYVPLWGWTMAFQRYRPQNSFSQQQWVGLEWFKFLFADKVFMRALRNTIAMSVINTSLGFITAIGFALLLNEVKKILFKRAIQTISYLPHFLSWVIVTGLVSSMLTTDGGAVNSAFMALGFIKEPIWWLAEPNYFLGSNRRYLCLERSRMEHNYIPCTGINPELYEAAEVDGAGRWRKLWHITLPGIRPTIVVLLIMNIGRILGIEFDRPYTMANRVVRDVADVLSTLVYRVGILSNQFSLTAAIGLFQSVICVIFLIMANSFAKKFGERGIW